MPNANPAATPVFKIELTPEDGLYPMPTWRGRPTVAPGKTVRLSRCAGRRAKPIIRTDHVSSRKSTGSASPKTGLAIWFRNWRTDFFRIVPSGGYTRAAPPIGQYGRRRHRTGGHGPRFLRLPPSASRYVAASRLDGTHGQRHQDILDGSDYLEAVWTQGSPRVENAVLAEPDARHHPPRVRQRRRTHGEITMTDRRTWWIR